MTFAEAASDDPPELVANSLTWYLVASVGVTVNEYFWPEPRVMCVISVGAFLNGNGCAYSRRSWPLIPPVTVPLIVADLSAALRQTTRTSPVIFGIADLAAMVIVGAARAVAKAGAVTALIELAISATAAIWSAVRFMGIPPLRAAAGSRLHWP